MIQSDIEQKNIENLLNKAGLSTEILSFENLTNGGNNRTYRVETIDGVFALKKYYRNAMDKRDRLGSEFSFLQYATDVAPQFVPTPYAQDTEGGYALYEFVEGHRLKANELTQKELTQAIEFFCLLNEPKKKQNAFNLPLASEPGFSIQDHIESVGSRIDELQQAVLNKNKTGDQQVREFIGYLSDRWQLVLNDCKNTASIEDIDITLKLDFAQRCISPSDFGFHNALISGNQVCFLDFEYAGWDDPARMVNDFFMQLAVPIPLKYYDWFVKEVMVPFPQAQQLIQRAYLLKKIYHIKWCCIVLNVFIASHIARRQFANPELDVADLRKTQLTKAKLLLNKLEVSNYGVC